jgi:Domain of unknown function (DUF4145)
MSKLPQSLVQSVLNNDAMECPHCGSLFTPPKEEWQSRVDVVGVDSDGKWDLLRTYCTNKSCKKLIIGLMQSNIVTSNTNRSRDEEPISFIFIRPKARYRPVSREVPEDLVSDFHEACLVLQDSPKASAALSRRCLEHLLEKQGYTQRTLEKKIDAVKDLSSHISENLHYLRQIGNFSAHPIKSENSGEIQDVESGEAEFNLDVLEQLFDFYYVQPAISRAKREAIEAKIKEAGRNPIV